jgi:hypothetical protein
MSVPFIWASAAEEAERDEVLLGLIDLRKRSVWAQG